MKNYELDAMIYHLERQLQYLYNDHKTLLNRQKTANDIKAVRMHIKQAEESLRLQKRMRHLP